MLGVEVRDLLEMTSHKTLSSFIIATGVGMGTAAEQFLGLNALRVLQQKEEES